MIFFDTETCGFHGVPVLIQSAKDDGPIQLYSIWTEPIYKTLELIEKFITHKEGVCGFNLTFDWFHICKIYTMLRLCKNQEAEPIDCINELAYLEPKAMSGPCIKPITALDLMLHARKGPYQSTMNRGDIRIKKIPTVLAWDLAKELEKRIPLKDIYFARRKDKTAEKWVVYDRFDEDGVMEPFFKDIVLKFKPSSALKALAADALNLKDEPRLYSEVDLGIKVNEKGYAPYALATGNEKDWKGTWPEVIKFFIARWAYNELAREYARDDVVYTRDLYKYFGCPPAGDDDSILACMVGAVRWKGFALNLDKVQEVKIEYQKIMSKLPLGLATTPAIARKYIQQHMDETESLVIRESTQRTLLENIAEWEADEGGKHLAAKAAQDVLNARRAKKKIELLDKLTEAKRFYASFKVIGTLTSRMSGTDGLNATGIDHTEKIRSCFTLADDDMVLCGGDFDGFEVTLAEADYNDPELRKALLAGQKIHALFGMELFPGNSYEDILASKGTDDDKYWKGKTGVFAMIYGGTEYTLHKNLGISPDIADKAFNNFGKRFKGIGKARKRIFEMFCSMRQPKGLGSKVEWHTPCDYIESMIGFRRYFTLENSICKALFDLAENPLKEWKALPIKVVRRERIQTVSGAVQSALFAAAFAVQASNMRAAANHRIQSSGAQITKRVQCTIWEFQPSGVHEWEVQPMNIHDEIDCPMKSRLIESVKQAVLECVETFRDKVPLIKMVWKTNLKSWADK